ncbi:tetratricopeptide repeat protein [Candidatus Nitrotoga arctica]|uniref:Sel1 protein n=1 Tax=Candidatus Nitrotoga arctica TaxID=453162 RepID=A0ABM8Z2X0_9PROT|nr:tetratricopeptide repeat protein [Candidatus Nitrotoga arctica]CAG9934166.1 Sel1 protein [Candidatus Nitrotoga arctica]
MKMTQLIKQLLLVYVYLFALNGQAIADSFPDALNAYETGDYSKAFDLFVPLAQQGNVKAQLTLSAMYAIGKGVPQDYEKAVKWYQMAAEKGSQGDTEQKINFSLYSPTNYNIPLKEVAKWYKFVAEQGNALYQYNIGRFYDIGKGVPQDYKEAVKWYRMAAEQGNAQAQSSLAFMYQNGDGVPQDYVRAHMWFNIAAFNEDSTGVQDLNIERRDSIAMKIAASQIAKAQELARKCIAQKFKGC